MPRTFRLYEELEKGEKGQLSDQSVSYGLTKGTFGADNLGEDTTFTDWNGTIIGPPNTNYDNRIYFLTIKCGDDYPNTPPDVYFNSKINLPCVNQSTGKVEPSKFAVFSGWKADYSMEKTLIALKNEMLAHKKLPQPADGDMF